MSHKPLSNPNLFLKRSFAESTLRYFGTFYWQTNYTNPYFYIWQFLMLNCFYYWNNYRHWDLLEYIEENDSTKIEWDRPRNLIRASSWQYNIFTRGTDGAICPTAYSYKRKGLVLMYVTYGDLFTFVIMLCAVITLVYMHKNSVLHLAR